MGSNSPRVELGDAAELIWFETGGVAENVFNVQSLPSCAVDENASENGLIPERSDKVAGFGCKLQVE